MKTILIKFDNSFFVRNFFRTDIFSILKKTSDLRLVFLAPQNKLAYYRKEFPGDRVVFDALPETRTLAIERFFRFVETASIHSHTATLLQKTDFVHAKGQRFFFRRVVIYFMRRILWQLGRFRWWRQVIRLAYWLVPSNTFSSALTRWKPDLVYCPSMIGTDFRLLKEAKKKGLKTLGIILSWDNLHSKTMLRIYPDDLIVHTDDTADQVERYADFPRKRMHITGIPQYDRYVRRTGMVGRDEFMNMIGGDPAKKLLVYAVSGKAGLPIDFGIVKMIRKAQEKGEIPQDLQILLRAYPRYDFTPENIRYIKDELGCLVHPSMTHIGEGKDSWEFDDDTLVFLVNTLAHADIVAALYTTFFIEAAMFDKPLIAVGFDERNTSYWDSAKRFFEWDHLRELDALKGIWRVESRKELIGAIHTYLKNPAYMHEGRERIIVKQAQFTDGKSGMRVANIIKTLL